jgi:hypothetical protein
MPGRMIRILVVLAGAAAAFAQQQNLQLGSVLKPFRVTDPARVTPTEIEIDIQATGGTQGDAATVQNAMYWTVTAQVGKVPASHQFAVQTVQWAGPNSPVQLFVDEIAGIDAGQAVWTVKYCPPGGCLAPVSGPAKSTPSPAGSASPGIWTFVQAKGKSDAGLYLSGTFLAGVDTKPLYTIDAQGNFIFKQVHKPSDWALGVTSALSTNASSQTPVDRTRVDPNTISGGFSAERDWDLALGKPTKPFLEQIDFIFQPVAGQFARTTFTGDVLGSAQAKAIFKPWSLTRSSSVTVYPSAGFEGGHNFIQPKTLFKQTVNLSDWNGISRAVVGVVGDYYILNKKVSTNPWLFTVEGSYQSRILFEPEPFVTVADIKAMAVDSVTIGRHPRPYAYVTASWAFSTYLSLTLQYKYGSQPPLFQFVSHQATIGLTFSAKQQAVTSTPQ